MSDLSSFIDKLHDENIRHNRQYKWCERLTVGILGAGKWKSVGQGNAFLLFLDSFWLSTNNSVVFVLLDPRMASRCDSA
jgi:hypothetical protein